MDRNIVNGTIIKLEDPNEEFIIVDNIIKDGRQFVVLSPFEKEEENDVVKVDYKKLTIIELKDEDEYEYLEDFELIKELVDLMMNKQ